MSSRARRRWLASIVLAAAVLLPANAKADDPEAAQFFRAGSAAYERRDFRAAAVAFEEAHRRAPRAATIYNAGLSWEAAGELARAADAYQTAIARGGDDTASIEGGKLRLARLETQVGWLDVDGPAGTFVSVGHVDKRAVPLRIHLLPGEHRVRISDARTETTKTVTVNARAATHLTTELSAPPPSRNETVGPPSDSGGVRRAIGPIVIGAGVVSAAAAVGLGLGALSAKGDFERSGFTDTEARADAVALRTWTNVAWAGALICGAVGLVLVLTTPRPTTSGAALAAPFAPSLVF